MAAPTVEAISFDDLPDASLEIPLPVAPEQPTDRTPDTPVCDTCEEVIVLAEGHRGRKPKYHSPQNSDKDCRPSSRAGGVTREGRKSREGSTAKAEREADEIILKVRAGAVKGALLLMAVDRYDAFVIMANLGTFCDSLRGILVRYDNLRKECLAVKGGGSVVMFGISCLTIALPIAAHHKLIPMKTASEALIKMPEAIFALQQRMEKGEKDLTTMMADHLKKKPGANDTGDINRSQ